MDMQIWRITMFINYNKILREMKESEVDKGPPAMVSCALQGYPRLTILRKRPRESTDLEQYIVLEPKKLLKRYIPPKTCKITAVRKFPKY